MAGTNNPCGMSGVNKYIGARYVPIQGGEWDKTQTYEPLVVVLYQGNSYTSKCYVPAGIDITNETYWIQSANYNAQVEAYKNLVDQYKQDTDEQIANLTGQIQDRKVPISANPDLTQLVYECARSYCENKDKLVYAHLYESNKNAMNYADGVASYTSAASEWTGFPINCSTLSQLITLGIDYYHSMYTPEYNVQKTNLIGAAGYCYNQWGGQINADNFEEFNTTVEMATEYQRTGLLETVNSDYSNIYPGDVIFFQDLTTNPNIAIANISHCGMVISQVNNYQNSASKFMYVDSRQDHRHYNEITFHDWNIRNLQDLRPTYVAHPQYVVNRVTYPKPLDVGAQTSGINIINSTNSITDDRIITVAFDWTPTAQGRAPYIRCNDIAYEQYSIAPPSSTQLGKTYRKFITFRTIHNPDAETTSIELRSTQEDVSNVVFFDGVVVGDYQRYYVINELNDFKTVIEREYAAVNSISGTCGLFLKLTVNGRTYSSYWGCRWSTGTNGARFELWSSVLTIQVTINSDGVVLFYPDRYIGPSTELNAYLPKSQNISTIDLDLTDFKNHNGFAIYNIGSILICSSTRVDHVVRANNLITNIINLDGDTSDT